MVWLILTFRISGPCSAGYYMTSTGCLQCGSNTYSGDGADICVNCPEGKITNGVSTSENDCYYGNLWQFLQILDNNICEESKINV